MSYHDNARGKIPKPALNNDFGADYDEVLINDSYTLPSFQMLTANNTSIYSGITLDLRRGPMIVEGASRQREQLDQDYTGQRLVCLFSLVRANGSILR